MISSALESKEYSPGMRVIIRNEEWMIKKVENNSLSKKALYCKGISPLIKDRESIFLADLEDIEIINPAEIQLVRDDSPNFKKSRLYIESNWRQKAPSFSCFGAPTYSFLFGFLDKIKKYYRT